MTGKQKFCSFLEFLDEIIKFDVAPGFVRSEWEHELTGDWLSMNLRGAYRKRVLMEYREQVEKDHQEGKRKPPPLKQFLALRQRGRWRKNSLDDHYQDIARLKNLPWSNQKIIQWIRDKYSDRSNPSQDIRRALARYGKEGQ